MKELLLIRHGKSSWKDSTLEDHDRPLSKRGISDAKLMADLLKSIEQTPEITLVSSAVRTQKTAKILFKSQKITCDTISDLYEADCSIVEEIIQKQSDDFERIAIVGHNPTFTELIQASGYELDNLPTCGIAVIRWNKENWSDCWFDQGEVVSVLVPKMFR